MQALYVQGNWELEWFEKALRLYPDYIHVEYLFPYEEEEGDEDRPAESKAGFYEQYQQFLTTILLQAAVDLPATAYMLAEALEDADVQGTKWLQAGLEVIERLEIKAKTLKSDRYLPTAIRRLIALHGLGEDKTAEQIQQMLGTFEVNSQNDQIAFLNI